MVLYSTSETATASHLSATGSAPAPAFASLTASAARPCTPSGAAARAHEVAAVAPQPAAARSKRKQAAGASSHAVLAALAAHLSPCSPQAMTEPSHNVAARPRARRLLEKMAAAHLDRMHIEDCAGAVQGPADRAVRHSLRRPDRCQSTMHMPLSMVNNSSTRPSCRSRRRGRSVATACPTWFAACRLRLLVQAAAADDEGDAQREEEPHLSSLKPAIAPMSTPSDTVPARMPLSPGGAGGDEVGGDERHGIVGAAGTGAATSARSTACTASAAMPETRPARKLLVASGEANARGGLAVSEECALARRRLAEHRRWLRRDNDHVVDHVHEPRRTVMHGGSLARTSTVNRSRNAAIEARKLLAVSATRRPTA